MLIIERRQEQTISKIILDVQIVISLLFPFKSFISFDCEISLAKSRKPRLISRRKKDKQKNGQTSLKRWIDRSKVLDRQGERDGQTRRLFLHKDRRLDSKIDIKQKMIEEKVNSPVYF